jgi:hypothetical protein
MATMKRRTHISGEHLTHRTLWHCAQVLFDKAQKEEEGSFCLNLAASLFIYLAFEAFLNYVGARAYCELWDDEKKFFSSGNHRGTLGKLNYIATDVNLALDKGRAPYQTVHLLNERRDKLVHARIEIVNQSVNSSDSLGLSRIDPKIYSFGDPNFVERAFNDVEILCDQLLDAAKAKYGEEVVDYSLKAFVGMHSHQSAWIG